MTKTHIAITANGAEDCGKTSLLYVLLNLMADAGLLPAKDTKALTSDPDGFFVNRRVYNGMGETVELFVDRDAVVAAYLELKNPQPKPLPDPTTAKPLVWVADADFDPRLVDVIGWERAAREAFEGMLRLGIPVNADEVQVTIRKRRF